MAAMFADTENRPRSFEHSRRRSLRGVRLVAPAAALLMAALPATAAAAPGDATVFVQSAESGKLGGGRLVLAGVNGRVSFATNSGRAGVISLRSLHRRLIPPGKPASGTLHIAGQRGGQELAFKLSRPRYNPARNTVAYRTQPLAKRRAAHAAGFRGLRRFGAASLSIIPHPTLTGAFDPTVTSSLAIDNSGIYPCAQPNSNLRCWGTLSGSGLQPGAQWTVWDPRQSFRETGTVPSNGSLEAIPLNFLCGQFLTEVMYAVSTTSAGQSITSPTVNRPAGC
jgi:hypothetical protein